MAETWGAGAAGSVNTAVDVREEGPLGMVVLRAKPDAAGLAAALGIVPGVRQIVGGDGRFCAWMSPDEYLLICPQAEVPDLLARIAMAMAGTHHLAADVSDARVVFRVTGGGAERVMSRLCPVDFARFPSGEIRRTRLAQVACALWREGDGFTVVVFRSVSRYARDALFEVAL